MPIRWTSDCQQASERLTTSLAVSPMLTMPMDDDLHIDDLHILDADASRYSIGDVLSQIQIEQEKVIVYANRTYSKAKLNYFTTRQERFSSCVFYQMISTIFAGTKICSADQSCRTYLAFKNAGHCRTARALASFYKIMILLSNTDLDVCMLTLTPSPGGHVLDRDAARWMTLGGLHWTTMDDSA